LEGYRRLCDPFGRSGEEVKRKIYLASSWRNPHYRRVLEELRNSGHEVYDFRDGGFRWDELEPGFATSDNEHWSQVIRTHPMALEHFRKDKAALDWCDTLVLLLPCGRSAHTEFGYAVGQRKDTFILFGPEKIEPELMYLLATGGQRVPPNILCPCGLVEKCVAPNCSPAWQEGDLDRR
jgi:hypothetical protein